MPILLPHPIKTDHIAIYGNMVGIRAMRYALPMFQTVGILPTQIVFKEQVLIAHSVLFSETPSKTETPLFSDGHMYSESPSKTETVIITNV